MIAKFKGKCCFCGKPTAAGIDIYDVDTKKNQHASCADRRDLFSASEAETTAARLGFIPASDVDDGFRIPDGWKVFPLPPAY